MRHARRRAAAVPDQRLKYNLTWSTDGLINEYCNPCEAIHDGKRIEVLPLEGLEHFSLDGVATRRSTPRGGLGTLCETLAGKVRELNYKTIRYRGHRDLMHVPHERAAAERPPRRCSRTSSRTRADHVAGRRADLLHGHRLAQRASWCRSPTPARSITATIGGENWSAIQITTAAGMCAVVDLHVAGQAAAAGLRAAGAGDARRVPRQPLRQATTSRRSATRFSSGRRRRAAGRIEPRRRRRSAESFEIRSRRETALTAARACSTTRAVPSRLAASRHDGERRSRSTRATRRSTAARSPSSRWPTPRRRRRRDRRRGRGVHDLARSCPRPCAASSSAASASSCASTRRTSRRSSRWKPARSRRKRSAKCRR